MSTTCVGRAYREFRELSRKTHERFWVGDDEYLPCTFSGFHLEQDKDGCIVQHQNIYMQRLKALPLNATFTKFRSMRMRLEWLANARPDCLFEISQLAQVTEDRYDKERFSILRRLNMATKYTTDKRVVIEIPPLGRGSIRVFGFSDASFANNHDLSTQLGHISFLVDKKCRKVLIDFNSYMSRSVVLSAMA